MGPFTVQLQKSREVSIDTEFVQEGKKDEKKKSEGKKGGVNKWNEV